MEAASTAKVSRFTTVIKFSGRNFIWIIRQRVSFISNITYRRGGRCLPLQTLNRGVHRGAQYETSGMCEGGVSALLSVAEARDYVLPPKAESIYIGLRYEFFNQCCQAIYRTIDNAEFLK